MDKWVTLVSGCGAYFGVCAQVTKVIAAAGWAPHSPRQVTDFVYSGAIHFNGYTTYHGVQKIQNLRM